MAKTKLELEHENAEILRYIIRLETSMEGLRRRNGQLLTTLETYCPEAAEAITVYTTTFNPISKIHHLVQSAFNGDWQHCKQLVVEIEEDFQIKMEKKKKYSPTEEHIAAMQEGRRKATDVSSANI